MNVKFPGVSLQYQKEKPAETTEEQTSEEVS